VLAVAVIAASLGLSGCAAAPAKPPLTASERGRLRAELLDRMWSAVRLQYPGALRPEIGSTLLVADRDWDGDVGDCMQARGFTVTRASEGVNGTGGIVPQAYAVADYTCSAQFVTAGTVSTLLSDRQYTALRDYYIGFVRPCLLNAGARSAPPPSGSGFVGDESSRGWNPYQQIWASSLSSEAVQYLQRRCPPAPAWLSPFGS
jgi:hypothetical protein